MARSELQAEVAAPPHLTLSERSHIDIDSATWRRLAANREFWRLVDRGILSVSQPRPGAMRLTAIAHVGRAKLGDISLEIVEKVEGALSSLLEYSTQEAFRIEHMPASRSDLGRLASLLVRQFVREMRSYVSRGRDFLYQREKRQGSLVGGRMDITRTIRLRAQGFGHLVAFERPAIDRNTRKNKILLTAVREVGRLSRLVPLRPADLADSRTFSMLFDDCRDAEFFFRDRQAFAVEAQHLSEQPGPESDLLALAAVILSHESFETGGSRLSSVPFTWFLNLERLFETAVKLKLAEVLAPKALTVKRGNLPPIFSGENREFRANPDLVVRDRQAVLAVGDVKYKQWSGSAAQADVYQLIAHSSAFHSPTSFLVFPHEVFHARELGVSSTGTRTWLIAVTIQSLGADLERAAELLGLTEEKR